MIKKSERGFTLIEIIIAIAVLSILVTIVSMSVHSVFENSVEANVGEFKSDLQDIRNRTMMEYNHSYALIFFYDVIEQQYGYNIFEQDTSSGAIIELKEKRWPKHFIVDKQINGIATRIETLSANQIKQELTFRFSKELGDGVESNFDGDSISTYNSTLGTSQVIKLNIRSQNTTKAMEVSVVKLTGRVNVDDL
ncbi:prepilin-type N-terminal cleavage/methylation domain-containing protein [Vallitaleaceae bacterium 9-2]